MKAVFSSLLAISLVTAASAADSRFNVSDPVAGTYYGTYKTRFIQGPVEAQIRALGGNRYDGILAMKRIKDEVESIVTIGKIQEFVFEAGTARFYSNHPNENHTDELLDDSATRNPEFTFPSMDISGDITPGRIEGAITGAWFREGDASLSLLRSTPKSSPTLGAKPPADAVVLFDGQSNNRWKEMNWEIKGGALEVGKGNLTTKDSFENALLHIEFRTPFMPEARGQARGNSGVYIRSVFEVQVLDSFGKFPLESNDCGGIYKVSEPDWKQVNACLPPGEWQTYDITFRGGSEKENRRPIISVMHNGKVVVSNAVIPADLVTNGTGGGEVDGGFLMLQDHGDAVQFRNIWVQPID